MHTEDESGGFWPGYVAAVASLVLSLLLIAAVLALTIYQVGMLAGKKVNAAAAAVVVQEPSAGESEDGKGRRVGEVMLEFPERGWRLDEAALTQLREQIRQLVRKGARHWELSLHTDTEDPQHLRGGYLRLLAVRNVLLEVGVAGQQVDVRLIHASGDGAAGRELRVRADAPERAEGDRP
jgi:hypothetical protein